MSCGCEAGHVLDLAELALLVHLLDEQELAAVDDRLGHHVLQAGVGHELANLLAVGDVRRHRHGAHHVLARLQRLLAHPGVVRNRAVDVDEVDVGVRQHLLVLGVSLGDLEGVGHLIHLGLIAAANGHDLGLRMPLIDRNELRTEAQTDNCRFDRRRFRHR